MRGAQPACGFEPVDPRHAHVEQDEVGTELVHEHERRLATGRLAHVLEPGCRVDDVLRGLPEHFAVVDGHHAHEGHGHRSSVPCLHPESTLGRFGETLVAIA